MHIEEQGIMKWKNGVVTKFISIGTLFSHNIWSHEPFKNVQIQLPQPLFPQLVLLVYFWCWHDRKNGFKRFQRKKRQIVWVIIVVFTVEFTKGRFKLCNHFCKEVFNPTLTFWRTFGNRLIITYGKTVSRFWLQIRKEKELSLTISLVCGVVEWLVLWRCQP